jgi:hypothetical protein
MKIVLFLVLSMSAPAWAAATQPSCAQQTPDIRNLMSVNEYTKSGLDKLTTQQVAALNAWLTKYTHSICSPTSKPPSVATAGLISTEKNFGKPPEEVSTTNRIVSHIAGEFHGWTGETQFHLTNGQVWIQAGPGYYETNMKDPKVVIKKLLIGYILQINGNGKEVFVRRIR